MNRAKETSRDITKNTNIPTLGVQAWLGEKEGKKEYLKKHWLKLLKFDENMNLYFQ